MDQKPKSECIYTLNYITIAFWGIVYGYCLNPDHYINERDEIFTQAEQWIDACEETLPLMKKEENFDKAVIEYQDMNCVISILRSDERSLFKSCMGKAVIYMSNLM